MSYTSSFKEVLRGVKMATASLILIWYDWFLVAFLAIPLVLTVFIDLAAYNILLTREDNSVISFLGLNQLVNEILRGPHWIHIVIGLSFLFLKVCITTIFMSALIMYSGSELKGKMISFTGAFARLKSHWMPLLWWSIIITFENVVLQNLFNMDAHISLRFLVMVLATVWYLVSWLVLPLIILQNSGIRGALFGSIILIFQNFCIIAGGALWLLMLSIIPNLFFDVVDTYADQIGWGPALIVIVLGFLLGIKSYILTAETLFKTMLYQAQFNR